MAEHATHVSAGPDGVVQLPAGVTLESIEVAGRDLVIHLPDGDVIIIDNGAVYVPQLVIGEVEIPSINLAALLIGNEPQPAAGGPSSSGGNFAVPVGDIGPGIGIENLLPPTELQFGTPEFREVFPGVDNKEPSVEIQLPGLPDSVTSVDEAGLPARGSESAGSDSASNSETATGSIVFTPGDEPAVLTINGDAVTHVGQVIHGQYGDLTITSIASGDVGFSYTLLDNTNGDDTRDSFAILVTDADGDAATATLHVDIVDDVPTAHADTDSVTEGGPTVADGNVVTGSGGSDANTTDGVADTQGADGAHVTGVVAGSAASASGNLGATVHGQYGDLVMDSTGHYTYTLNPESSAVDALTTGQHLTETFTYTITDGDNDTSTTTLTITINGTNDAPEITAGSTAVSEEGLSGGLADTAGTSDTTNSATASGNLTITDPDNSSFTVTLGAPGQALTSHGVAITWSGAGTGTLIGSAGGTEVIRVTINGSGHYEVTLSGSIDHPTAGVEDATSITVPVSVNDGSGGTDSSTLTISIEDDSPTASVTAGSDAAKVMLTQDHDTIGAASDTATADFSTVFTSVTHYGGDGAGSTTTAYALHLAVAEGSASGLSSNGATIYLYENGGVITGSTSASEAGVAAGNTVFTLTVDGSGVVTSTQYAEVDHGLPGDTSNYDSQIASLANGLVNLSATTTITDGDGDTASGSSSIDLGGNVQFADDGPSVTVTANSDAQLSLTTQDHDTIGAAFDTATGDVSGLFTVVSDFGADGAGTNALTYSMTLLVDEGTTSGLSSNGATIYLYENGGVVIGSTSANEAGVDAGNTIFTLSVDSAGVVTSTQYAEIDHGLPGDTSNYDGQIATLADGLVGVTASDTVTDGDGDTASDSQTIDLGGNIHFADDGPSVTERVSSDAEVTMLTQDHDTIGAASDTSSADFSSIFTAVTDYGADGAGTVTTTYALSVTTQGEDSGLASNGAEIYLYDVDGVITGSTSATEAGVTAGNTIFTVSVDASGVVTQTQYAEIDHPLPGSASNYDGQVISLGNELVTLSATTTVTDGDGDTATASQSVDLGGNVNFADDGPHVTVDLGADAGVLLTTQDHDTIGAAYDTASASVASVFTVTPDYGADGAGTTVTGYSMTLLVDEGTTSGLSSNGAAIYLYDIGGVVTGSTSATEAGVDAANTIFTLSVDSAGTVTQTQYAEIDHALPGSSSNYDTQLATLADGLVGVTASATTTDGDGDTATDSQTVDLGGNVRFADDGPSVGTSAGSDADVTMLTQDHDTIAAAFDTSSADFSGVFGATTSFGADGPGTVNTTYALSLAVAEGTASGLASNGDAIYLYENGGVIVGSTSASEAGVDAGNTIFTLSVDGSGVVTQTQYAEVDHGLPGDTSNYDSQIASLANGLVNLSATTTITDGDGDTASGSSSIDLGGNVQFADDGPSVTVRTSSDAQLSLTTQDHDTIGAAFDTATGDVSGLFTVVSDFGADGAGTNALTYSMTLLVDEGTTSGLSSNGATIYLYENGGVITGSTSASEAGVDAGNTIFTLSVDSAGVVTSTQYAEIDHGLPGDSSNYDGQIATLADGLVGVTASDTITDGDGDTASDSQTIDLGGNIHFADDGPSVDVTLGSDAAVSLTTQDHETIGAAYDTATADLSGLFTVTPDYGADGAGTTATAYSMTLLVDEGTTSGLSSDGAAIYLYENASGVIVGSTSATEGGITTGNTIFTLEVDSSGVVTSTQYAEIDHGLPGDTGNYDAQIATLANGLVGVTATATTTDGDGDTATDSQTVDLGGNVHFADDGPSVSPTVGSDANVNMLTQDHDTIGAASDTATGDFSVLFDGATSYGADGPGTTVRTYDLSLKVAEGTSSGLASNGATIYLYEDGGVITGSTSASEAGVTAGNTIFTVSVDASGVVTQTQYAEIDHPLPGSASNYDGQVISLADGLVQLSATTTVTDGDGDTAAGSASVDLGGNIQFADDGPSVVVTLGSDSGVVLTTQDHDTIGAAFDTATASVASVFTVTPTYGADGAGATATAYSMTLLVDEGTTSGLSSDGHAIYLFETGGVIVGSTSATEAGVTTGNTIFTLSVDASGTVTQTQYAEIDHALPGATSNYDTQLATLANGLVGVTATATTTDGDGDTATDSQLVDLGGNVHFADDGPSSDVTTTSDAAVVALTQDHDTIGAASDTATADFSSVFHSTTSYGADGAGTTSTAYALSLAVAEGTSSGLASNGATVYLYEDGGVITGSTSATEGGVTTGNTIFTLEVDSSGVVTSTQYAEIDHSLPGATSNYDAQIASLGNGLVNLSATTTVTDGDGDTATDSASVDLGGNIQFADDGPSVSVTLGSDAGVVLTTQDHDTIGAAFDTITASVASVFTVTPTYGADGPGTTATAYSMTLLVDEGTTSGLSSDGHAIYLFETGGVIVGSTSATEAGVTTGNTIFTLSVDASGTVTQTQYAEIDHALPGATSNYDTQLATLANGLVGVTATATTTDGDGDTATDSQTVDLGGNVHFADDGPAAHADADSVKEDGPLIADGNVITGTGGSDANATDGVADASGADGAHLTGVVFGTAALASGNIGSPVAGAYGSLTIDSTGAYTYTLNNGNAAVQALDTGEHLTETFTYTITDGDGDTSTTTLSITIDGTNDAPVANPDTNWTQEDLHLSATGNVLESHSHAGAPSGSFADQADTDVDVEPLVVTTTGDFAGTYGTLHLNADGSYTYTLYTQGQNATAYNAVQALNGGQTLTDSFNYTASDGTATAGSALTVTIFGANDAPVVTTGSVSVSEEGLLAGLADTAGTPDTTNSASASGDLTITDPDSASFTVTLGTPTTGLTSGGDAVTWSGAGTGTLIGSADGNEVIRVTINGAGHYTVTLSGQIDHPDTSLEDALSFVVPVTVSDGSLSSASSITVSIEDDSPVAFTPGSTPISGGLTNVSGAEATYVLDTDHNIVNNIGADQGGAITFAVADNTATSLTSAGEPIHYWVSDNGQVLEARTDSTDGTDGNLIFTVTLDQPNGEYDVHMYAPLDNGAGVEFNDLSGGVAGNPTFKIIGSTSADSLELLVTPINTTSVNSDSDDMAAGSQFLSFNTGLRIDFGDFDFLPHGGGSSDDAFTMNSHANGNGFRFTIDQISNGSVADILLVARDANLDTDKTISTANFSDDPIDPITKVSIYDSAGHLLVTATDDTTAGGVTVDFQDDGTVTVNNAPTGYSIETWTGDGYGRLEVTNAGTSSPDGKFSISHLQLATIDLGSPVPITIPVTLTDHDGDHVSGTLDFTVAPNVAPPVALDLNGDGLAFVDQSAGVHFDYFGDGDGQATAWVDSHDGLLAIDLNADGAVNSGAEIVFAVGGSTDLEGLRLVYDSNHDGVLNASDADFAKFGVWQDANANGVCDPGEFKSLTDAGITSINLTTTEGSGYTAADGQVTVHGTTTFTWADGGTGAVGDVSFAISPANDGRIVEQAQRGFATASAGYTSSLVAAGLIVETATAFAHDVAPTLHDGGDVHTVSTVAVASTPASQEATSHTNAPVVDHFAAPTKDAAPQSDDSHTLGDSHDSGAGHASVGSEADSHAQMSSLLDASHDAPAAHAPVFMDSVQMPVINVAAMPAQTGAASASAPGAAQVAQVAEVLADALHGGTPGSISIDHLLSSLPAADAKPMLLAEAGADTHADSGMLTAIAHAQIATVGFEASYLVHHDSVPVNHA